ncbi:MAG TPA: hypothetical protein ENF78_03790 [Candidatus Bathyarchaeota archaeon]|nr:hypothetical protein [Candidatus Bathyarchaeota archaeon]
MGSPSSSSRAKGEGLTYRELSEALRELGLNVVITKSDYSRATRQVKRLIKALLDRVKEAEAERPKLDLTREDIEYIIYRLRTIYGDSRATSIVAKLSEALRRAS